MRLEGTRAPGYVYSNFGGKDNLVLRVQSEDGSVEFGEGLDFDELRWIRNILELYLFGKMDLSEDELPPDQAQEGQLWLPDQKEMFKDPRAQFRPPQIRNRWIVDHLYFQYLLVLLAGLFAVDRFTPW